MSANPPTYSVSTGSGEPFDLDLLLNQASRRTHSLTIVPSDDDQAYLDFSRNDDRTIRVKEKLLDSSLSDCATYSPIRGWWVCTSNSGVSFEHYGVKDNIGMTCGIEGCPHSHTLENHLCSVCKQKGHGAHECEHRCSKCKENGKFNNAGSCPIHFIHSNNST
jgi:hypothetical protein